jgi:CBS domain-containing protein
MAAKRLDSVVVVRDGAVAGILTTVDVCSALAASLNGAPVH